MISLSLILFPIVFTSIVIYCVYMCYNDIKLTKLEIEIMKSYQKLKESD